MKILAFNSGSSSIKYTLYDVSRRYALLLKGSAERIGQPNSIIHLAAANNETITKEVSLPNHRQAMLALHQELLQFEIDAVGHRIVHGGECYRDPVLIDDEVIKNLKKIAVFAPLHCQPNITGIEVLQEMLPKVPQVAVFDTATHATMPAKAFLYGIPLEYYEKYKIRKYGFHGINHAYVAHKAAKVLEKPLKDLKIITCHLGNGCSITAFEKGHSIDNSMGLTPLEGVMMGSRSGDLDPAVVLYLIDGLGLQSSQVTELLNKKSGLLGLSGKSDMRDIIALAQKGDQASRTAIDLFVYRIQKYVGAYIAALNGIDAIVFTGGIGENSAYIRARIAENLTFVSAFLDQKRNEKNEIVISSDHSAVSIMSIPANEELVIAQQTHRLLTKPV